MVQRPFNYVSVNTGYISKHKQAYGDDDEKLKHVICKFVYHGRE